MVNAPVSHDTLRFTGTVVHTNTDLEDVEPSGVGTHERGGVLPVVCAAPAMAKSTGGVEPAGGAEKATAAKLDAFERKTSGATRGTRGSEQEREATARQGHA
jgi:hypothetical protein